MNLRTITLLLMASVFVGCGRNYSGDYLLVSDHVVSFGVDTKTGQKVEEGAPGQLFLAMAGRYKEDYVLAPARHYLKIQQKGKQILGELQSKIGGRILSFNIKNGYLGDEGQLHLELANDSNGAILKLNGLPSKDPSDLLFSNDSFLDVFGGITSETQGKNVLWFKKLITPDLDKAEGGLREDLAQTEIALLNTYSDDKNNPLTEKLHRAMVNSKVQIPDSLKKKLDQLKK